MSSLARYKRIVPDTLVVNNGTPTGDISDIQHWVDGNQLAVQEGAGGPPCLRLTMTFEQVTSILGVFVLGYYQGSATHNINIEIYNYTTTAWDALDTFANKISKSSHVGQVFDDSDYINGSNQAQVRLDHVQSGNASHDLYIDYIALLY